MGMGEESVPWVGWSEVWEGGGVGGGEECGGCVEETSPLGEGARRLNGAGHE